MTTKLRLISSAPRKSAAACLLVAVLVAFGPGSVLAHGPAQSVPMFPAQTMIVPSQATSTQPLPVPSATTIALTRTPTATPTQAGDPEYPYQERPIIVLHSFSVDPGVPAPGASFTLHVELANKGEHFAENVSASFSGEAFLAADQGAQLYWNSIDEGDAESGSIRLRTAQGMAAGVHTLLVALNWDDSYGSTFTDTTSIGIPVGDAATRPVVSVTGSRLPSRVPAGVPFQISLDLLNSGGMEARNVVAAPQAGPVASVGAGVSGPITLAPGGAATVLLQVMASEPAEPGAVSQPVEIRYDDAAGTAYSVVYYVGVLVSGDAALGPLPMVVGYRVLGAGASGSAAAEGRQAAGTLAPGTVFDLSIDVANVGATAALRTRMVLGGASIAGGTAGAAAGLGPFAPVETGSVRYLETLAAGENLTVEQKMVVAGDAKPGVYTLPITFTYVDADGKELESSELITLLVARPVSLSINTVGTITNTLIGEPVRFSVEVVNSGDGTLKVGDVEVLGSRSVTVEDGRRYVGSLDAGALDVLDATVTAKAPGEATVRVVVHYMDDFNQARTVEKEFTLQVADAPPVAPVEEDESGGQSGNIFVRFLKGLLGLGASGPPDPAGEAQNGDDETAEERGAAPAPSAEPAPASP